VDLGSDPDDSSTDSSDSGQVTPPPQKKFKIPKHTTSRSRAEVAALRQDFPNLAHYPDELFRTQQLSDIITLDNKIGGGGEWV
jgi:hypothetical protein